MFGIRRIQSALAARKGLADPAKLTGWGCPELLSLGWLLAARLGRGLWVKCRMGRSSGLVLCDRHVRLWHARHISAGRSFSIEEGCEIVGLSKRGIVFGDRCTVGRFATIRPTNVLVDEPGEGLRLGDHSNIGAYSYIGCSGYIEIGSNVLMGPRVSLLAENHCFDRADIPIKAQGVERRPIVIEDDCWIGAGAIVVAGVTIRRGCVVAAGAVVTADVPPYSIVAGVPARVVRQRPSTT